MKSLLNNFLRGLLLVFPLGATLYIIFVLVRWSNDAFNSLLFEWLNIDIPGLGIVTVFLLLSLIGSLFSKAFTRPMVNYFERLIIKMPVVKIIYTSIKELTEAFVGDKKKFNKPVVVDIGNRELKKLGFVTQESLKDIGIEELVAVYCPHSYNFSGNLFLVPPDRITFLDVNPADVMKYIVSGGVTRIETQAE